MPNPAEFALRRPRVIALATLLGVFYGVLSYLELPRQENPTLADRFAAITTYLPGAEPDKVELLVTKVLEEKIAEVDDIENIFSTSGSGTSYVLVEMRKGAPLSDRLQEVRDKVQQARALFPEGTSEPEVDTETLRTHTMILALAGRGVSLRALREYAKELERELELLPDVRRVSLLGTPEEEIEVQVDLRKLSQRRIALTRVIQALADRNVLLPGGELEVGALKSTIQTSGAFNRVEEIASVYLGAGRSGLPIRLSDVGVVVRRIADPEVLVRASGIPAVSIAVEMLPECNAIAFGQRVREFIADWQPRFPEGMRIEIVSDEPTYVERRLSLLRNSLLLGMALVVVATLLGMGWRSGAIASLSIPLALTIAMGLVGLAGVELHQMSIAALVIGIGLVVDEAIIVTDNIQRHVDLGASPREAAIRGLKEIHLAMLAGAATTIAAFIPLMLMVGDVGDFLRSIPIVVSLMLVASVAVAHFVTPLMAAFAHERAPYSSDRRRAKPSRLRSIYLELLGHVVARTRLVLTLFVIALAISIAALRAGLWPPEFFPAADRNQFVIDVALPAGAPLEETEKLVGAIERRLAREPLVRDWTSFLGAEAPKFYYNEFSQGQAENIAMLLVNTDPTLPIERTHELVGQLDRELKGSLAGARVRARALKQGYAATADVAIYLQGDSLPRLRHLSRRIREIARRTSGVTDAYDSFGYDPVSLEARVDDARANLLGISHLDVATILRSAIDGVAATTLREDDEEIDIVVRLAAHQRRSVADLETLPVYSPRIGQAVPLSHLATLVPAWTIREVRRWNRKRESIVSADVAGRPVVAVTGDVEKLVRAEVPLPDGYSVTFRGERKEVNESFLSLAKAALTAMFLIYIILVVRFHSLSQPLLIILAIPMSLIGSIWGLLLTGNPLGVTAFLGMIALTGIVVNDSIVLLDYINTLRGRGLSLTEAVMEGATTRLRAIVLTSLTTIVGLLPLSLSGGAFWAPFGFVLIFGLAASTVLTLLVQPAAYLTLERYRRPKPAHTSQAAWGRLRPSR